MNRRGFLSGVLAAPFAARVSLKAEPQPERNFYSYSDHKWYPTFMALMAARSWHLHDDYILVRPGHFISITADAPDGVRIICNTFAQLTPEDEARLA